MGKKVDIRAQKSISSPNLSPSDLDWNKATSLAVLYFDARGRVIRRGLL